MSTLVVFGASGNVGWHVLQGMLKADPATLDGQSICKIRAVTRDPTSLRARLALSENMEVEIVKGELSTQGITEIAPILEGATRVFVCLPQPLSSADMVHVSKALVDEAKRAGVKHIVRLSSARIDAHSLGLCYPSQGPLGEAHEAGEKYTKEQGIGLTSVRPTSFSSNFVKYDLPSVKARAEFCSPLGETASVNWVSCVDVAAVVVTALLDSKFDGMVLDVTGPPSSTLTAAQMKALLETKTGREIRYTCVPPPPLADMEGLWAFLRAGGFDFSSDVVLQVTGKAPQEFAGFLDSLDLSPA